MVSVNRATAETGHSYAFMTQDMELLYYAEAGRIKDFLGLPKQAEPKGLKKALSLRFYSNLNNAECIKKGNTLLYRTPKCRIQTARLRKKYASSLLQACRSY